MDVDAKEKPQLRGTEHPVELQYPTDIENPTDTENSRGFRMLHRIRVLC